MVASKSKNEVPLRGHFSEGLSAGIVAQQTKEASVAEDGVPKQRTFPKRTTIDQTPIQ